MILLVAFTLTIVLHPSIQSEERILTKQVNDKAILRESILTILSSNRSVFDLLVIDNNIKPGFLLLSNKVELKSTGLLDTKIESDLEIKIIPISHGG